MSIESMIMKRKYYIEIEFNPSEDSQVEQKHLNVRNKSNINKEVLSKDHPPKMFQDVYEIDHEGNKGSLEDVAKNVESQVIEEINAEGTAVSTEVIVTLEESIIKEEQMDMDLVDLDKETKSSQSIKSKGNITNYVKYDRNSNVNNNQKTNSNPELVFQCPFCPSKFNILWRLKHHERLRHIKLFELKCEFCGKYFRAENKLTNHLLNLHHEALENELGTTIPKHKCAKCENLFDSIESLKRHRHRQPSSNHNYKKPTKVCQLCGMKFRDLSRLKSHEYSAHGKESDVVGQYICFDCGKEFPLENGLYTHIRNIHMPITDVVSSCVECGKQYNSSVKLKAHEKSHSEKHTCDQCGSSFKQSTSLKNHIAIKHRGDRNFKCDTCGKVFTRYTSLKQHETLHTTKSKPFQCTYCEKFYVEKRNIIKHVSTKHPGESISFKKQTIDGEFKIVTT